MSGSSYTNVFGGSSIRPSQPSYLALTIAANTALVWPLETAAGSPSVAAQMDITASAVSLELMFPPGNTGSLGAQAIVTNVGSNTFTVTDQAGNTIAAIATTQSWLITLTANSTANGTWRAYQLASTVSTATASALAGPGLQATGSQLQGNWVTSSFSATATVTASYRGNALIWTGAAGTLQFDTITNLGTGWYCAFSNEGTGNVTLTTTGGQTINGLSSLVVGPGNSGIIIAATGGFSTFGALLGPVSVAAGGTGATTAAAALTNLGATTTGASLITAPSTAAVVALLGLSGSTFTERTVSTNQTLAQASSNTIFVATAAVTLTLPLSSTLTASFVICAYAYSGTVTITPQTVDAVNGGAAGASYVVPLGGSVMLATDAAGNYWPLFVTQPQVCIAGEASNVLAIVTAASASITYTADQIITATALSGVNYVLSAFNQTLNTATNGAGGMDHSGAPTSGFVAIYAIYNPSTGAQSILGVNATSAVAPTIYGGAYMPSGYSASALIGVWPTNSSGLLVIGEQYNRIFNGPATTITSSLVSAASPTALSVASAAPLNAKLCTLIQDVNFVGSSSSISISFVGLQGQVMAQAAMLLTSASVTAYLYTASRIRVSNQNVYYLMSATDVSTVSVQLIGYEF